ncbi:hypothetical protein [Methylobacterium sp. A54F]
MRRDRERRSQLIPPLLAAALVAATAAAAEEPRRPARDAPIDNWAALRTALAACWAVPADTEGSLIAYRFGLTKDGAIRGKPLVTARQMRGRDDPGRRYEAAATDALARCFPIPVTPGFGAALGESPIRLRFVNTKPGPAYQINSNITVFAPQPGEARPEPRR